MPEYSELIKLIVKTYDIVFGIGSVQLKPWSCNNKEALLVELKESSMVVRSLYVVFVLIFLIFECVGNFGESAVTVNCRTQIGSLNYSSLSTCIIEDLKLKLFG